ncbi:MAG: FG-GAP repeat protein, partial [Nonlabens sp.]|nr:FG-GAP repeat protein [Nonlabens sp.]
MMKTIFTLVVFSIAILTSAQVASFEQKIKSPDPGFTSEMFGNKVAIDGDIMVVSDPRDRHDLTGQVSQAILGAVYVYRKDANGDWVFEQKLRHPNVTFNSNFSFDLAVKNNLIVVGSNGHQTNANGGFTLNGAGSV